MGERTNCKTGAEVVQGDCLVIDVNTTMTIQGITPKPEGAPDPGLRVAHVTIGPGSLLKTYHLHDTEWYQLCGG